MTDQASRDQIERVSPTNTLSPAPTPDELYGRCLAEVFKEYAPHVAERYSVEERPGGTSPTESVASFEITKLVLEKDSQMAARLKNVYHLLAHSGSSIAVIISRTHRNCRVFMAVGIEGCDSEKAKNLTSAVRDAFLGNFPGSECGPVRYYSDDPGSAFGFLDGSTRFGNVGFSSVGIVSNVATDFSEGFLEQGIERLIDGVSLGSDEEYTLLLVGKAVPRDELVLKKNQLYGIYTGLSPFTSVQRSWGVQESTTWTKSLSVGTAAVIPTLPVMLSASQGISKGNTVGTLSSDTVTITEYGVKHMLETIERQVDRLEECEALGMWQFSAYVVSPKIRLVNEVARMYLSLTQGEESHLESPAINIWNAHRGGGADKGEISRLRDYMMHLDHPVFVKRLDAEKGRFNSANWPDLVFCTADLSGAELPKAINLPRKSIPGLPVIECAPFGREVSSYDTESTGDVRIGCIHHMHHDEDMPVGLSASSLASHVFVTGSTGCGKSNTVCKLLDEANANFLVIEPAKGEYRYEFESSAKTYGTNPLLGEVLRINPFVFPEEIHVYEHIDRILEVFNVCWPMYAAMPAVLKEAVIRAYESVGWNLKASKNELGALYPTFKDICREVDTYIEGSDYSTDTRGDYKGSLKTRLESLTNGINELVFCNGCTPDEDLFDDRVIVDLSRVGSSESKALIMGVLVIKLQEHRMNQKGRAANEELRHITVIEEAHNLLRNCSVSSSVETGGSIAAKSVEMISNAIAEMRTYGEAFVIVDQSPGMLDMSAIRNTNTKIIMRLPDEGDRNLVGKAANLNDTQIQELARLQRGVAAIYQNEWIEPVLCHIGKHEREQTARAEECHESQGACGLSDADKRYLNTCLLDPSKIDEPRERGFAECVRESDLPVSLKAKAIEMAFLPLMKRRELYGKSAYEHFGMEDVLNGAESLGAKALVNAIRSHLSSKWEFEEGSGPEHWGAAQYLFVQTMLSEHANAIARHAKSTETAECISELARTVSALSSMKPVM
ncbi:MAG TPA: ATP-binding protein [Candidatus Aphodovivens excrementavium]|nr:ATP-binding protein [Candidatus Aphodovivens excrementavium]